MTSALTRPPARRRKQVRRYDSETFRDCVVRLDDASFKSCSFVRATLHYGGGAPPQLVGCSFNSVRFEFDGPAAATVQLLLAMSRPESGLQQVVRNTFACLSSN